MNKDELRIGIKVEHPEFGKGITVEGCEQVNHVNVKFVRDMAVTPVHIAELNPCPEG